MELFKIFGTLALLGQDEFNKGIDSAGGKASQLATKLGDGLKTAVKEIHENNETYRSDL